jgi:hypothetical protein
MMVPPKLAKVSDDGGGLRLLYGIPKGSYFYHALWLGEYSIRLGHIPLALGNCSFRFGADDFKPLA